ncbi:MAG TPA: pentapeptide repeat-containing protein, partial [Coleofasciculaceae cyanobacterium]
WLFTRLFARLLTPVAPGHPLTPWGLTADGGPSSSGRSRWLGARRLGAMGLVVLLWAIAPGAAHAQLKQYAPPISYSNAELSGQDFSNQILKSAEFSNANLTDVNFSYSEMPGASFSGSLLKDTKFHGTDLTNAFMDSVKFIGTDLSDAILVESILLGSIFKDVNIEGADFEMAILDGAQVKELCAIARGTNSQTGMDTRESLGCRS